MNKTGKIVINKHMFFSGGSSKHDKETNKHLTNKKHKSKTKTKRQKNIKKRRKNKQHYKTAKTNNKDEGGTR